MAKDISKYARLNVAVKPAAEPLPLCQWKWRHSSGGWTVNPVTLAKKILEINYFFNEEEEAG